MVTSSQYNGELLSDKDTLIIKARDEASNHRPPTDAVRMDHNESSVQAQAESWIASEHQVFTATLTEASRFGHELQQKLPELEGRIGQLLSDKSLQSEAGAELSADRAPLVAAAEERMRAEVDLRSFRAKHGIVEQASYPESHIWHFAVIIALALLETIVNSFFYENAQGLLGGFFVAAGVSAVNMSGALVLGMLFRFKNLRDREKRIAGWACAIAFVVLAVYCNALFSAFRAEYQLVADPSDPTLLRAAFRTALAQAGGVFTFSMHFGDLMSFILFGFGLLLSCFAFYKGITFDDKHPGYGDNDRLAKAARKRELKAQEGVRLKLKAFLQERRRRLQAIAQEPAQLVNQSAARAASVQHSHTTFLMQQDAIVRDMCSVLRAYREANASIRAAAAPAYFATMPEIRPPTDDRVLTGVLSMLGETSRLATEMRDRFQDRLADKINEVQEQIAKALDSTFDSFLRSVESDAEATINRMTVTIERTPDGRAVNAL
jgi:hypothetical protein